MSNIFSWVNRRYIRWDRRLGISKRQRFVVVTGILTLGLLLTQLVSQEFRYPLVFALAVVSYLLSAFALREDLTGAEWVTILTLPALFTAAVALFYFLLPVRWLTRVPVALLYGVGMYALLLTENIYNVAAERTIALLRAAHSVGFLLTLVTYFLFIQTILAFRLYAPFTVVLVGVITFILGVSVLWVVELTPRITSSVLRITAAVTCMLMQLAWIFSFLPTKTTLIALLFTTLFYSGVGMGQQYLVEKLYKKTVIEFVSVSAIVLTITILATHWRGNV